MYNNYPSDGSKKICTVTAVDMTRKVCKCISDIGEVMSDVRWLVPTGGTDGSGSSCIPVENSKVLVDVSSGFPFILGSILSESADLVTRPNIGKQGVDEPDIADYTTIPTGDLIRGPGTPKDQRVGDIINTSDGGAIQGVLSSGTVINKASPLAQVICSRWGDLVRVVARNFERFSDVDEEYKGSIRGRVFSLRNIFRTPEASRNESPSYVRMEGDTLAAELVGKNYANYGVDEFPETPEDNGIVIKEYTASEGVISSTMTEDVEGNYRKEIRGVDSITEGQGISEQIDGSQQLTKSIHTGETARWHMNEEEFHWESGGGVRITGKSLEGITIRARDGATIQMTNEGELYITTKTNAILEVQGNLEADVAGDTRVTTVGNMTIEADLTTFNLGDTTFNMGNTVFNTGSTGFVCSEAFSVTATAINLN